MDTENDGLLGVDIATLEGYFAEMKRRIGNLGPRDRQKILGGVRDLIGNDRSAVDTGFDPKLAQSCRQSAALSRAALTRELACGLHPQTLLKYEHGDFIPNPKTDSHRKYLEWLSSHGYTPDQQKMRVYHLSKPDKRVKR